MVTDFPNREQCILVLPYLSEKHIIFIHHRLTPSFNFSSMNGRMHFCPVSSLEMIGQLSVRPNAALHPTNFRLSKTQSRCELFVAVATFVAIAMISFACEPILITNTAGEEAYAALVSSQMGF